MKQERLKHQGTEEKKEKGEEEFQRFKRMRKKRKKALNASHCIDLMLEDIGKLPLINKTVQRGINIAGFIYSHF